MKTDFQLKQDVINELAWDAAVNDEKIQVDVSDGIVTLSGDIDSYAEKYAAEKAAQRIAGVKGLAVELDVVLPWSSNRTDADIASVAASALEWNALVPKDCVKVMVENGWLTLSGIVAHQYQRRAAVSTLRSLLGVIGISNLIMVKNIVKPAEIKLHIEAALQRRAHSVAHNIEVAVNGDHITLSGTVGTLAEKQEACSAAAKTSGVANVIDRLFVVY